jgi:predicted NAD-dependent protein-ADP-ribosyltransferase YbiA (DUF1768 family)
VSAAPAGGPGLELFGSAGSPAPVLIDRFTGVDAWLSDYAPCSVSFDGEIYPTREHAFQAAKTLDLRERARIAAAATPQEAHSLGQAVTLRPGWNEAGRYAAKWQIRAAACNDNPDLAAHLDATGTALLVDGNTDHDRHWGQCVCTDHQEIIGGNNDGLTWMAIRSVRRDDPPDTWARAAVIGHGTLTELQTAWTREELGRVYGKLRRQHGTTAVLTAGTGTVDLGAAELAQQLGVPVWCYLTAPDHTAQLPRSLAYRHEQLRARTQRTAVLASRPIEGRPGRAADLQGKVTAWLLRDSDALVVIGDRNHTVGRAHQGITTAKATGRPVITIDPIARSVTIAAT